MYLRNSNVVLLPETDPEKYHSRWLVPTRCASLLHQPRTNVPPLDESLGELLVCNLTVFDTCKRNGKETMTGGADQFETLLGIFNPFQVVTDSRKNHDRRAVFFVAPSASGRLGNSHIDPLNQWRFRDTIGLSKSPGR